MTGKETKHTSEQPSKAASPLDGVGNQHAVYEGEQVGTIEVPTSRRRLSERVRLVLAMRRSGKKQWGLLGKIVFSVVTALLLPGVALLITSADSDLSLIQGNRREPNIRCVAASESTLTLLLVMYYDFHNSGLLSDFIDKVDIHAAKLDEKIKSEPRFVDRQRIPWRQTKELRFELLVTIGRKSSEWHAFLVFFYDSKGRQVGFMPVTVRLPSPGDIIPKTKMMTPTGAGIWEPLTTAAPPPMLVAASLLIRPEDGYPSQQVRIVAKLVSDSGAVIGETIPGALVVEANGDRTYPIKVVARTLRNSPIFLQLVTDPPPTRMRGSIQTTLFWGDGKASGTSFHSSPPATAQWPNIQVNPNYMLDRYPNAFFR